MARLELVSYLGHEYRRGFRKIISELKSENRLPRKSVTGLGSRHFGVRESSPVSSIHVVTVRSPLIYREASRWRPDPGTYRGSLSAWLWGLLGGLNWSGPCFLG